MSRRYALKHWLEIQAREAVEAALRIAPYATKPTCYKAARFTKDPLTRACLERDRERAINDAAIALLRAERLHRKLVEMPKEDANA